MSRKSKKREPKVHNWQAVAARSRTSAGQMGNKQKEKSRTACRDWEAEKDDSKKKAQIIRCAEWYDIEFKDIKKGDSFRLLEPNGKKVTGSYNETLFVALGNAYLNDNNVWTIEVQGNKLEQQL